MKFKKLTAAVLAAAMLAVTPVTGALVNSFSVTARAEDILTEGDYSYTVNEDGESVTITKYNGTDTEVDIPETLDGKNVTAIGDSAFYECTTLTNVTIPNGVTIIGESAFCRCTSLISVAIPDSVTTIGRIAFWECSSLASVTIPDGVSKIEFHTFGYCSSLTSITIPGSVTSIGDEAFRDCTALTSVTLLNGVESIVGRAFWTCKSLTTITIPESVTDISQYAFDGCTSLETIDVSADNNAYCSVEGVLFNKDKTSIEKYPCCKTEQSYTIPNSVVSIGYEAFWYCRNLVSVTIPNGVTSIGWSAFDGCGALTSVTIPDGITSIPAWGFRHVAFTTVTIPDGVTEIGVWGFAKCKNLTTITIPDSVIHIEGYAFEDCSALEDVYYGGSKSQWEKIFVESGNDYLLNATIHFAKEDTVEPDTSDPTSSDTSEPTSSDTSDTSTPTTSDTSTPTSSTTSDPTSSNTSTPTSVSDDDFHKENEVSAEVEATSVPATVPDDDRITSITINPAFNMKNKDGDDVELDLSKISIKANEIYDEEGLKRAEEALGETLKGNTHYNLLDLTLLYDGEDFSNGYEGLVKVIIPLPNGHRDKNFSCFRLVEVDGKMEKQIIPGEQTEDSYIIYLEHFSLYALVADSVADSVSNNAASNGVSNPSTGVAAAFAPIAAIAAVTVAAAAKKKK